MSDVSKTNELIEEARFYESPGHVAAYAEGTLGLLRKLADALEAATRERDAALAAVERVRAIHLPVALETKTVCNSCAEEWPCDTREALDGAPEPEGRWEYRGRLQSCGYVAEGYISAEHAMNGLKVELEDHPYLQMDDTAIVERARVREWLPVEGESE